MEQLRKKCELKIEAHKEFVCVAICKNLQMCGDWGCAPTRKFAEVDAVPQLANLHLCYKCTACVTTFGF